MTPPPAGGEGAHGRGTRLTLIIAVLTMLAPFSVDTYLPSLPDIGRDLAAADWQVQQTLSLYLIAFAVSTLVYGPLSDAFGRRTVVLASLVLYTISSIGCVFATNVHWLLAMRIGQGLTASGPVVIGRAIVRDAFHGAQAQRVMSKVTLLFAIAPAIAPIIGGYLHDDFGWRSVFWFLTAIAAGLFVWTALLLPETLAPSHRHSAHPRALARAYWHAALHGRFIMLIFAFALAFCGLFLYIAASPALLYDHLGRNADEFGYLFVPVVIGLMAGALLSGRLAGHHSHAHAVNLGLGIMLSSAALGVISAVWLPSNDWTTIGPIMLYASGMTLALPNLTLIALDCLPNRRGLASALQSFLQMASAGVVAGVLVPLLADRLWELAAGSLALVAGALVLWRIYRRFPGREPAHA